MFEGAAPGIGDAEQLGRTAAPPLHLQWYLTGLDVPFGEKGVEVPPDGGRGEPQTFAEVSGRDGAVFEDQARNPCAGSPFRGHAGGPRGLRCAGPRHVFHNISVA
ncbi:hypothetical protein HerbRD11066_63760 [Herbidospora sp. RD11066]